MWAMGTRPAAGMADKLGSGCTSDTSCTSMVAGRPTLPDEERLTRPDEDGAGTEATLGKATGLALAGGNGSDAAPASCCCMSLANW